MQKFEMNVRTRKESRVLKLYFGLILLLLYCGAAFLFLELYIEPALYGPFFRHIAADSHIYMLFADYVRLSGGLVEALHILVKLSGNLVGPVAVCLVTNNNIYAIFAFNVFLFVGGYYIVVKDGLVNSLQFLLLLMINPLIFLSLLSVNKEIMGYFVFCLFTCYLFDNKRKTEMIIAIILSLLIRWEQAAVMLVFVLLNYKRMRTAFNRALVLLSIIMSFTLLYPQFSDLIENIFRIEYIEGNTIVLLTEMQENYKFFLVVIPKMILNMYGSALKYLMTFQFDQEKVVTIFIIGSEICFMLITFILAVKKRISLRFDTFYFFLFYLLAFSLTPFVQSRYIFPCYVILCFEVCRTVAPVPRQSDSHARLRTA